jgi:hypothetical protein
MKKMIYKKNPNSQGEIVIVMNTYKGMDNKLKAIIMHDPNSAVAWKDMPYEEVKLSKLRPMEDFKTLIEKL